eukprot:COSAG01_NODE_13309_length_1604_cov_1.309635_3_plen_41_part_01
MVLARLPLPKHDRRSTTAVALAGFTANMAGHTACTLASGSS